MLGWMDDEALHRTLTTGRCTYWSRSRQEYWVKGDTSGHQQWVKSVALDCDGDTVLVKVDQVGAACHTGDRTCFDADACCRPRIGLARRRGQSAPRALPTLADRRLIPVTRGCSLTARPPVGLYRKLADDRAGTFLLESAENGRSWSRYSFVGVRSAATLTERDGSARWIGTPPPGVPTEGEPLKVAGGDRAGAARAARRVLAAARRWHGRVRHLRRGAPTRAAARRHRRRPASARTGHVPRHRPRGARPPRRLGAAHRQRAARRLTRRRRTSPRRHDRRPTATGAVDRRGHGRPRHAAAALAAPPQSSTWPAVERAREYIKAGDIFQVVPSQRFETKTTVSALDIYRVLRARNPSPYLYLLRFDGFDVVGSSPEAHVTVKEGRALMHPIAGSRPRGATPEDDNALAAEMLADPKERAEHVMLVDLAPQRPGPGVRARHGRGRRLHVGRALQPHHAHRLDRRRPGRPRPRRARRARRDLPGRHLVGRAEGACDGDHRGVRAHSPRAVRRASSATSTSPATSTPRSRFAPRWCATARSTCRPAPGWWPTPTRPPRTPSASTRPTPCCQQSRSPSRSPRRPIPVTFSPGIR